MKTRLKIQQICKALNAQTSKHIDINDKRTVLYGSIASEKEKIYIPTNTANIFHADNSFVKLIMGPYNSGKTTCCLHEIVRRACAMPAWDGNGRRRSKWAIVRNTSGELYSTTLQTWLQWFGDLGDIRKRQKPLLEYEHVFNDGHGLVVLELVFIALDREEDIRKIKSLEVTGAYINELSEVPQGALSHFKGRVNHRYPSKQFCDKPYWSGILADTNPPHVDHWIYKDFEQKQLESYRIFHQPAGLIKNEDAKWEPNIDCDNYNNMSSDYYTKLAEGNTEDFVKVYCLGQYGSVTFGKIVYPEYNDDLHCIENIEAIQGTPINLFWDFGLTPRCLVLQLSEHGQLRAIKEYGADDMGIKTFAESIVIPGIARDFPYCKVGFSDADPSGIKSDEIMEELSCIGVLNDCGITTFPASTNLIEPRLNAVRYFLNKMILGKPGFVLSKFGCPTLRRGFINDYHYKRVAVAGEERYRNEPDKNMASHIHDCLQYGALRFASDTIAKSKAPKNYVDIYNPVFRWQG